MKGIRLVMCRKSNKISYDEKKALYISRLRGLCKDDIFDSEIVSDLDYTLKHFGCISRNDEVVSLVPSYENGAWVILSGGKRLDVSSSLVLMGNVIRVLEDFRKMAD